MQTTYILNMMKNILIFLVIVLWPIMVCCNSNSVQSNPEPYPWKTSTPQEQGFDPAILATAFEQADSAGFIDALLVIRNGYIVAEEYYNDCDAEVPHNVMSVSKSFLSAMTGLALEQGYLDSLGEKMMDYFPEYVYPEIDSREYDVTLRHLLTMRMGLEHEQQNYFQLHSSPDWVKATIEFPLTYDPGERFRYNTYETHLLSVIITRASEMSTFDFAEQYLTGPLGIDCDLWETDPQGNYFGGNTMYFTPREMAVLGYVYQHNGKLGESQIVPAEWVELTLSPSTNNDPNEWGSLKNIDYAYLWWLGELKGYEVFSAIGHGGQFVMNVPALNMIIVSTANNNVGWDTADEQERAVVSIMSNYILPAVVD